MRSTTMIKSFKDAKLVQRFEMSNGILNGIILYLLIEHYEEDKDSLEYFRKQADLHPE